MLELSSQLIGESCDFFNGTVNMHRLRWYRPTGHRYFPLTSFFGLFHDLTLVTLATVSDRQKLSTRMVQNDKRVY